MAIIKIILDKELLQAVDLAARHAKLNRSAVVREALRKHLQRLELRAKDDRDREGYLKHPQTREESNMWEAEVAWLSE